MVLRVKKVSIRYHSDAFKNMRFEKRFMSWLTGKGRSRTFYALRQVSVNLDEGEVLGIVGKNGSGKSTLLKAITGTIYPTRGTIERKRKVSALLELGTGFDSELTVRENIYLRAALLGYSKEYVNEKYKEILAFSELEEFENNMFQNLSSGMRSRMAFSIVSIMEPEILVLDEVFSVGDGAFREKSRKKMMELMNRGVSTILVSHSLPQVRKLCTRVLWLDRGRVVMDGDTQTVCAAYEEYLKTGVLPAGVEPLPEPEKPKKKAVRKTPITKTVKKTKKVVSNKLSGSSKTGKKSGSSKTAKSSSSGKSVKSGSSGKTSKTGSTSKTSKTKSR